MRRLSFVLLALAALEMAMRFAGVVLQAPSDRRNQINPEDAVRLRILALGESTTADYFSDQEAGAWPRRLEADLRKAGIDARVYNEGLGGTTTAMIASKVPSYLEEYRPHIVISMMGINDSTSIRYSRSLSSRAALAFLNMRTVKLVRWLGDWFNSQRLCKISRRETDWKRFSGAIDAGVAVSLAGKAPAGVEQDVRKVIPGLSDEEVALILTEIEVKLRGNFQPGADLSRAQLFADRAFSLSPYNHYVAFWELNTSIANRSPEGMEHGLRASRELLKCGRNVSDDLLSEIAIFAVKDPGLASSSVFRSQGFVVGPSSVSPTREHYRLIHQMLTTEGVIHVAMQYPTLPVASLVEFFKGTDGNADFDAKDVIIVTNQENFRNALKSKPYEEVFRDRFRGSWGHPTGLGHQLLAESALKAVLDVVRDHPSLVVVKH